MAGITLKEIAAASVPTPDTNKDTLFFDSGDGLLKYKDDAGATSTLGAAPFIDSTAIIKGSADATKLVRIEADGLTTGTTRVWTAPDKDGTVAMTSDITGTNSGTNTGDQTSIVGITGTKAEFDTACTDGNFAYQSDLASYQPLDTQLTDLAGLAYAGNTLKVVRVNAGETAFELATVSAGSGDVVGPGSATDNAIARYDTTTGKLIQSSSVTLSDLSGSLVTFAIPNNAATTGASQAGNALTLKASDAVASTDTAGAAAGGEFTAQGGAAARNTSGNADGGAVRLKPGAGIGTGVVGQVLLDDDGTVARPALAFDIAGNKAYGFSYLSGVIQVSINGVLVVGFNSSGIAMGSGASVIGNATTPGVMYAFKRQRFDLTSSTTLTSGSYNGATLTNLGAGAGITSTLVTAAQGYNHRFIDDNASFRWTIKPNTADTIIWTDGTVVTAATGSIVSTARYDAFDVEALDATVWLARNVRGTWTVTA